MFRWMDSIRLCIHPSQKYLGLPEETVIVRGLPVLAFVILNERSSPSIWSNLSVRMMMFWKSMMKASCSHGAHQQAWKSGHICTGKGPNNLRNSQIGCEIVCWQIRSQMQTSSWLANSNFGFLHDLLAKCFGFGRFFRYFSAMFGFLCKYYCTPRLVHQMSPIFSVASWFSGLFFYTACVFFVGFMKWLLESRGWWK